MCTGTEFLIGASVVTGVAGIAQGFVQSAAAAQRANAQQASAQAAAALQQASANQEAAMLENNAKMVAIEADALREKRAQEEEAQKRNNLIKSTAERANAGSSGLTVAGTSLERLLVQNDEVRSKNLALTLWNYDMQIQTKDYEGYLFDYRADVTRELGVAQADVTRYQGELTSSASMAESSAYLTGGITSGIGSAASIASKIDFNSSAGKTGGIDYGALTYTNAHSF